MRALLIYPVFPKTYWSLEATLRLIGRKAVVPPLGLATVAALLPQDWECKIVNCNLRALTEEDWAWADIVLLSGMIVQNMSFCDMVREAKRRGKPVAVGGPYVTSLPQEAEAAGADYIVMDEGEITIPPFLKHLDECGLKLRAPGEPPVFFRANGEKPEITVTPIPRFDLLDLFNYDCMAVQYSRGCPFLCEFCDIIKLYGRRPRTKAPEQLLAELECLYRLEWRRPIFMVDDNFIGNKRNVKKLLSGLAVWQREHGYPFPFVTEASIDLAADAELMQMMVDSNFGVVFIGVETPDEDSLELTRKHQNNRAPMIESLKTVTDAGLRVMMGMILGFDNEEKGAGERIIRFTEESGVPHPIVSMLQALPNTGLWTRLEKEGRLRAGQGDINQTTLLNFVPTRPVSEIAEEYLHTYEKLYDPLAYIERVYRHFMVLGRKPRKYVPPVPQHAMPLTWAKIRREAKQALWGLRALTILCWRQGVVRKSRSVFWRYLFSIARTRPHMLDDYLSVCANNEHFLEYRDHIRKKIEAQLRAEPNVVQVAQVPKLVSRRKAAAMPAQN